MNVELLYSFHLMEIKQGFMPSFCEYHFRMWCLVDHLRGFLESQSAFVALEEMSAQTNILVLKSGCLVGCLNLIALKISLFSSRFKSLVIFLF